MKKQMLSVITLTWIISATAAASPAWADDQTQGSTAATPAAAPKSMGARIASWPLCIAGFTCGTIVGTPICFVRKLPAEVRNLAHGFVGSITEKESKLLLIPVGIAWLPFAGTAALMEAPVYAFKDAYMAEKPFSKEQFSLGELDQ
jgi:hypothetical protein